MKLGVLAGKSGKVTKKMAKSNRRKAIEDITTPIQDNIKNDFFLMPKIEQIKPGIRLR